MTHDASHSYTYDAENRITQVDGGSTATYAYDVEGRRVSKVLGGVETDYIYDLVGHVVETYGGGCGITCLNTAFIYLNGQLLAQYWGGTYFVHTDRLGSTRLLTGYPTASVVECDERSENEKAKEAFLNRRQRAVEL